MPGVNIDTFGADVIRALFDDLDDLYHQTINDKFYHRFQAYKKAQRILSSPVKTNLFFKRANSGTHIKKKLMSLIEETDDPRKIFSFTEYIKSLFF